MFMVLVLGMKVWAAPSCARLKRMNNIKTSVRVVEYEPRVVYRRISRPQLIRKSGDKDTLGLTVAPLISSMEIQTAIIDRGDTLCVFIEEVTYRIGYKQQLVYIDQKYAPSSCAYNVILEHENLHVQYNNDSLKRYKRQFGRAVKMHFRGVDTLEIPKSRASRSTIQRWVNRQKRIPSLKQLQSDLSDLQDQKHGRIDSEHSYKMTQRKCDRW